MHYGKMLHERLTMAVGAAALSVVSVVGMAVPASAQTDITVAVPNPSAITWAPMWAAIGEGYFAEEGLNIDVQAVDGSSQVLQAMSAGQADIGAPGPGPVLGARARGLDVVLTWSFRVIWARIWNIFSASMPTKPERNAG